MIATGNELNKAINRLATKSDSLRKQIEGATQHLQDESKNLQKLSKEARKELEQYQRQSLNVAFSAVLLSIGSSIALIICQPRSDTMEAIIASILAASLVTLAVQVPQLLSSSARRAWWESLPNWLTRILSWPTKAFS